MCINKKMLFNNEYMFKLYTLKITYMLDMVNLIESKKVCPGHDISIVSNLGSLGELG